MIALTFDSNVLPADINVKINMANEQMQSILTLLKNAPQYHTLTTSDRARLKKDAYADVLVDNLVLGTTRYMHADGTFDDISLLGFTYAAFDPSLYAGNEIRQHLQSLSKGCCCFCETFLEDTNSGQIGHFRPVNLLDTETDDAPTSQCSPYYELAYELSNLTYCCKACDSQFKAARFPVGGKRYPSVALNAEEPLLVNPYQEDPRDHIRFNPLNACAYPYDQVLAFFQQTQSMTENEVLKLLWSNPGEIPSQWDSNGQVLSTPRTTEAFNSWLNNSHSVPTKGQITIDILGLNRQPLLLSRLGALASFRHLFSQFDTSKVTFHPISEEDIKVFQYRSLAVDAFNSWYWQSQEQQHSGANSDARIPELETPKNTKQNPLKQHIIENSSKWKSATPHNLINATNQLGEKNTPPLFAGFPEWFRSCIMYLVTESELLDVHQRHLVLLHSEDALYGKKSKEKCLLLPVNWLEDQRKVIKVQSFRNIWETTFAELASSRPMELLNIFANNKVWVEGAFPPIVSNER